MGKGLGDTQVQDLKAILERARFADEGDRDKANDLVEAIAGYDPLTGLANRRLLSQAIDREIHVAQRTSGHLAILALDVDNFKMYNDTYGHSQGDYALETLARVLKSHSRARDTAARNGGEEFMLVLPETNLEEAISAAEMLLRRTRRMKISRHESIRNEDTPYAGEKKYNNLEVSIGISVYPDTSKQANLLVGDADKALYAAKQSGRNKYLVFNEKQEY